VSISLHLSSQILLNGYKLNIILSVYIKSYLSFDSRQGQETFLFSIASRSALGHTQPPIQWVPGALSPRMVRQGREADHSLPSSAEVKNDGAVSP
jgi:hypothetical protein